MQNDFSCPTDPRGQNVEDHTEETVLDYKEMLAVIPTTKPHFQTQNTTPRKAYFHLLWF